MRTVMNKHDKDNLKFLLTVDKKVLINWLNQASDDDIRYAMELIDTYTKGLSDHWSALDDKLLEENWTRSSSNPYADANAVLSKFRLKN